MKKIFLVLLVLTLSFSVAESDELDLGDITESEVYRDLNAGINSNNACAVSNKENVNNYTELFRNYLIDTDKIIHSWLGLRGTKYKSDGSEVNYNAPIKVQAIIYKEKFKSDMGTKGDLKLSLYIPCPRYLDVAKAGLFEDYIKLDNEKYEIIEKLVISNKYNAVMYENKEKECKLYIKMPKESRLYISGKCDDRKDIIAIAEDLSIERFEYKISN